MTAGRVGVVAERPLVVGDPRPVRRADLDEHRAARRDHLGDPEAATDLDELTSRHDDPAARPGERGGGEQHRTGAVVDRQRRLGSGQFDEQPLDVGVAAAPAPAAEVELEVGVPGRRPRDGLAGRAGKRRAAEVGVDDRRRSR